MSLAKRIVNFLKFLFFFIGPGMLYHFFAKRIYWKKLDMYGNSIGFHRKLTRSYADFGELLGERKGRAVRVRICYDNPSAGPWISVGLHLHEEILTLYTYKPMTRPLDGWEEFTSPNSSFNYLYKTRQVKIPYGNILKNSPELFNSIVKFYKKWIFSLSNDIGINGLLIDGEEIRCIFGPSMIYSMIPYISPKRIEKILPDMIELAEMFDGVLKINTLTN